jgi:hypothetical protein
MVTCGVARMKTWLLEGPMPTIRTPQVRVNDWPPGTCRWAAREAINRLDGTFTEMDVIIPYHAICRSIKHRPGNPERTIRRVVSDLVRAGVLIRTAKAKLQHGSH